MVHGGAGRAGRDVIPPGDMSESQHDRPTKALWRATLLHSAFVVFLVSSVMAIAGEPARKNEVVLTQNIAENVLWTRRLDRYTLQVLTGFRSTSNAKGAAGKPSAAAGRELPNIEAWLLRKEGAAIPAIQRWQTPNTSAAAHDPRQNRAEVLYAYSLSEGADAVAAVICIDGECFVRKIVPFQKASAAGAEAPRSALVVGNP